jgi:hypothetical protein
MTIRSRDRASADCENGTANFGVVRLPAPPHAGMGPVRLAELVIRFVTMTLCYVVIPGESGRQERCPALIR